MQAAAEESRIATVNELHISCRASGANPLSSRRTRRAWGRPDQDRRALTALDQIQRSMSDRIRGRADQWLSAGLIGESRIRRRRIHVPIRSHDHEEIRHGRVPAVFRSCRGAVSFSKRAGGSGAQGADHAGLSRECARRIAAHEPDAHRRGARTGHHSTLSRQRWVRPLGSWAPQSRCRGIWQRCRNRRVSTAIHAQTVRRAASRTRRNAA